MLSFRITLVFSMCCNDYAFWGYLPITVKLEQSKINVSGFILSDATHSKL